MNKPDHLTLADLQAYQTGQLPPDARQRIEQLLREDPFYADALAGLEALQQSGRPVAEQTQSLHTALQQRIQASVGSRQMLRWWHTVLIACILFALAVTLYLIFVLNRPATVPPRPDVPPATTLPNNVGEHPVDEGQSPDTVRYQFL